MRNCRECISTSFNQAMQIIQNEGATLIDVRTKEEYNKGHLPKSICIPIETIQNEIVKTVWNKNQRIVVYCSTGVRSMAACQILHQMGYKNVYTIYGGWKG